MKHVAPAMKREFGAIAPPGQEGVAAPVRRKCEASEAAQAGWWFRFKNISA